MEIVHGLPNIVSSPSQKGGLSPWCGVMCCVKHPHEHDDNEIAFSWEPNCKTSLHTTLQGFQPHKFFMSIFHGMAFGWVSKALGHPLGCKVCKC